MSTTCTTNFSNLDKFKCDNAERQLKGDDNNAFLFNLTMNPQRDPDEKRILKHGKTKSERPRDGEEDQRYLSLLENEKERREALNRSIISFQGGQGGGRMQRRRKRKRKKKRTQKRRRKKRKRRTRR